MSSFVRIKREILKENISNVAVLQQAVRDPLFGYRLSHADIPLIRLVIAMILENMQKIYTSKLIEGWKNSELPICFLDL